MTPLKQAGHRIEIPPKYNYDIKCTNVRKKTGVQVNGRTDIWTDRQMGGRQKMYMPPKSGAAYKTTE